MAPVEDDFDEAVHTVPDGTNIPFDHDIEAELAFDDDPTTMVQDRPCTRCGAPLLCITDASPMPAPDEALRIGICTATQRDPSVGGWRWCAIEKFMRGVQEVYLGPERRGGLPAPSFSGPERRRVHEPPAPLRPGRSPSQDVGE